MNFKEYWEAFLVELREKHAQNKRLDKGLYYEELTNVDTEVYNKNSLDTVQDLKNVVSEYESCTRFSEGYITVDTKIDTDVDGWSDGEGHIEVESVYAFLVTKGVRPLTDKEFEELVASDSRLNYMFKMYMQEKILDTRDKEISDWERSFVKVDCKILELFKEDIITFNQVVKATLSNCSL